MLEVAIEKRLAGFTLRMAFRHEHGVLALFGASGSGKSLTLRAIAGLLRPDAGRITLEGETLVDVARRIDVPPERRRVGYVPQHYALFPHLTVAQNIAFGLDAVPRTDRRSRVDDLLTLLDLEQLADRRPAQLSGGQQQRVAVARALATRPRLLLLDEPFAALDTALRRSLRRELLALQRRFATPMIIVSHDLADVTALHAMLTVVGRGQALQTGAVGEVLQRPASPEVARILGVRNLLRGVVTDVSATGAAVTIGPLVAPTTRALPLGASVTVVLAPERLLLVRPDAPAPAAFPGVILDESRLGPIHTLVWRPDRATDAATDLEIDIAAGPYHELRVSERRTWRVRIPPDAVTVLEHDPTTD